MSLVEKAEEMMNFDKAFADYYSHKVKGGTLPLEFAGAEGKKLLKEAFAAGGSNVLLAMLFKILGKEGGESK